MQFLQLFQALRRNPSALPIDDEARAMMRTEAGRRSGVEFSQDTDETTVYAMWEEILETIITQAFEGHIQGATDSKAHFLEGLTKASKEPWLAPYHHPGDRAFPIYAALLFYEDEVEKCKSVAELHRWLTNLLGEIQVSDIKRIEKLCDRIGLRFRGRGRPKKPKV
jgi:hypothetical protein